MRTIGGLRRQVRAVGLGILRHMPRTRLLVRKRYWAHEGRKYDALAKSVPVDERLVFFESFGGRSLSCSPACDLPCDARAGALLGLPLCLELQGP